MRQSSSSPFQVYVRWRPLLTSDGSTLELERSVVEQGANHAIAIAAQPSSGRPRTWKSGASFTEVFPSDAINSQVYEKVVAPTLPLVMEGATCNFFAYGHSGSGKTHTIIGYDYEDDQHLGLYMATAHRLFQALCDINLKQGAENDGQRVEGENELGLAVRLYEVRGNCAYDLCNNSTECHVREGPDGQTHIRGQTEMLENGKVRVRPITAVPCWSFEQLRRTVLAGLELRKTGTSSVHDESSRTHAILELEVVNRALLNARGKAIEREAELVPVGKRATDIYLEEHKRCLVRTPDGKYMFDPSLQLDQARIDVAEAEKKEHEDRLKAAEELVKECFKASLHACLGGKYVFVDLAGSEYFDDAGSAAIKKPQQSAQERKQGRQINTDLFALKEVIRARALHQPRIPFRSSPLTMILRSHFLAQNAASSAMILTVSPAEAQFAATVNTLKYGNLVGVAAVRAEK